MQNRIKSVRKSLGLTQAEFGAKIAVKGNTITTYEKGTRVPSDAVINSICREFDINEEWLRTGNGEPKKELSKIDELMGFVGSIINDESSFRRSLLTVMSRMTLDEWNILEAKATELLEEMQK